MNIKTSEEMKTELTPVLHKPLKIRDTILQPITHVTTDVNLMKGITDIEMTTT